MLPIGLSADRLSSPVAGSLRTGEASEYTTRSTWPPISALISSITLARVWSEKASALIERLYRPWALANLSKAAALYQPAVPGLLGLPGFSKNTPRVSAPKPNAAVMRAARP